MNKRYFTNTHCRVVTRVEVNLIQPLAVFVKAARRYFTSVATLLNALYFIYARIRAKFVIIFESIQNVHEATKKASFGQACSESFARRHRRCRRFASRLLGYLETRRLNLRSALARPLASGRGESRVLRPGSDYVGRPRRR